MVMIQMARIESSNFLIRPIRKFRKRDRSEKNGTNATQVVFIFSLYVVAGGHNELMSNEDAVK